jgi:hypothetical protein
VVDETSTLGVARVSAGCARPMSPMGQTRPSRSGGGICHVRCAPRATAGRQDAIRRNGPKSGPTERSLLASQFIGELRSA